MSRIRKITGAVTNDARFFSNSSFKKGENHELREELRSPQRDRKRDAVKKVIANMTVGKDVSTLFTDVINCIQTDNLELKKLVYLYLINYAKTQPDLALLAVNTFVKDANDSNPLIRALAIRTMGCIRVEKITEYLCEPLARCLRDDDPYVRKTAAVCVAKLYNISPELVEERGFLDSLGDLIGDSNPTVVSNAISALSEISEISGKDALKISTNILSKLLTALNECTEWGQVFILDVLPLYLAQDAREAEGIIERILPRLQHNNSAVVMSAIKVILHFLNELEVRFSGATNSADFIRNILKKLAPPLITLLNSEPEIQYVALRNINLIIMKRPKILENEIKVFFCKYNDPIYVKMEKLEIIIKLINEKNIEQVLLELKEYSMEVDVDFVKKSIKAIGRCAIKLEKATEKCISVLLDLIKTKVSYIIQECIVVIKDIFRKYPNRYEGIIANLCENLEDLDEPEAKASMVWIIGEYAERIDNADELLDSFLETFNEETSIVQLQLLTATVKLFLKQPSDSQEMMQKILNLATEHSDNPDLRDRGYIYWRLLSSDPEAARAVVLATKPEINDDTFIIEDSLLEELLSQLSTLSSIYHKPADSFIIKTLQDTQEEDEDEYEEEEEVRIYNASAPAAESAPASAPVSLLDLDDYNPAPAASAPSIFSSLGLESASTVKKVQYVKPEQAKGVFVSAGFTKKNNQLFVEFEFGNTTSTPFTSFAVQFNKNIFGLSPANSSIQLSTSIANNSTCTYSLPLVFSNNLLNPNDTNLSLQTAVKNIALNDIFYFTLPIDFPVLLNNNPNLYSISPSIPSPLDVQTFANQWKTLAEANEVSIILKDIAILSNINDLKNLFINNNMPLIFDRELAERNERSLFFLAALESFLFPNNQSPLLLIEIKLKTGQNLCKVSIRSPNKLYGEQAKIGISKLLV